MSDEWIGAIVIGLVAYFFGYRVGWAMKPQHVERHETTQLTVKGETPFIRLESLLRVPLAFSKIVELQSNDEMYFIVQLEGQDNQPVIAYTTDAGLFYRLSKLKKGADIILAMDERERIVVAEL
ncbi:hypothetical protein HYV22_04600 [Candidatus Gottesmanbacteria bacterium]|nr:hypothetical protein [Candidatus Gottesmanbacteria bacterium]